MQCWLDILPLSSWNVLNDPWSNLRGTVTIPICIGSLAPKWNSQALIYFNLWSFATSWTAHKAGLSVATQGQTDRQTNAVLSSSRESKMEGLHDARQKSDFSSLSITLWLSWHKEGRRKIFHMNPGKVKAKTSGTGWAENIRILPLLPLWVLLTCPEDLISRPVGLMRPKNLSY